MRAFAVLPVFFLVLTAVAESEDAASKAKRVLDRYLEIPQAEGSRMARMSVLAELKEMPKGAVSAAEQVLLERASPNQRLDIVGALGDYIHTDECARLLHRVLQDVREPQDRESADYELMVRSSAAHGLRLMAARTHLSGGRRTPFKPDSEPEVQGLVPYLISAANDKTEVVRLSALYGLADSRDPAAVTELRNRLKDTSWEVRFYAACFLTEYQDASGLPEMRKALSRFIGGKRDSADFEYYGQVEMLLASFERITGKSFGEIPLNPDLSGDIDFADGTPRGAKQYSALLRNWEVWWNSQPDPKPEKRP